MFYGWEEITSVSNTRRPR